MKISKLFHWLYAFLMFLPVTFLLPSLLYFGFNDNATAQEYTKEEPRYYDTNTPSNNNEIYVGNVYYFVGNFTGTSTNYTQSLQFNIFEVTASNFPSDFNFSNEYRFYFEEGSTYVRVAGSSGVVNVNNRPFAFVVNELYQFNYLPTDFYTCLVSYQVFKEYQEVTYTMGITESINQSILDTFDLPMFSWTSNNFIIAPFNYITNLFGLPNGNVVNKYLDYWLSISIVYLCFDVIMYVPLLVHRWLDKGIVE